MFQGSSETATLKRSRYENIMMSDLNKNTDENAPIHKHHHHGYEHSQHEKQAVINRLSKAVGHIEAIKRMVQKDLDCSQVMIQLAAVRSAINNTGKLVLKNHISHCITHAIEEGDEQTIADLNRAIDRFMK